MGAQPAGEERGPRVEIYEVRYEGLPLPIRDGVAPPLGYRNLEFRYRPVGTSDSLVYSFRMEGLESDWALVGPRTTAYYRGLEPGSYTFQVSAARPGERPGPVDEVPVVVEGYVYEQPWVLLLVLSGLVGGTAVLYRRRVRQAVDRAVVLERLVHERTRAIEEEKGRAENALAVAEAERATAREALGTVEEQAVQLLRMDHMKTRLFTNLSHEFRTPLALILDPLDRALSGALGPLGEPALRSLEGARQNAHRLLHLINQILDLAKLEAGSMDLRARETDLVSLLRQATSMFASEAERRGVDLQFQAADPDLPAVVDREKVEMVLFNLITNALKATGRGGKVVVSVRTDRGHAEIAVRDTGVGIPEEDIATVFDRFYQAETGRLAGGTGIGLSLVRELAELHHGAVGVESVPGFGSTFTVRLPLGHRHFSAHELAPDASGEPSPGPSLAATATAVASDGRQRDVPGDGAAEPTPAGSENGAEDRRPLILVVEDNPELREAIASHLRPRYRVAEAEDGAAAFRAARARRPDLVLSDVLMPGVDGLALCRRLKADERLGDTPVVLLTARASPEDRLEALQTGADDVLTKPFAARELLARVENLVRSRVALRGRYSEEVVLPATGEAVPSAEAAFLERVYAAIHEHLADESFSVGELAVALGVSESTLKRRLKPLAPLSPLELIRERRLERAAALLLAQAGTVSEVAARVGFGNPSYFARRFRDRYGVSPSEFGTRDVAAVSDSAASAEEIERRTVLANGLSADL